MFKSKKARVLLILGLAAILSLALVTSASARQQEDVICAGCVTVYKHCDIKAVIPAVVPFGGTFAVIYKGTLTSLRFRNPSWAGGGIQGWMYPDAIGTSPTTGPLGWFWYWFTYFYTPFYDSIALFTNQGADGGAVVAPGPYYAECFGPGGSTGNPQRVILLGPND